MDYLEYLIPLPIPEPHIPLGLRTMLSFIGFNENGRALAPAVFVVCTILSWPLALALRYINNAFIRMSVSAFAGAGIMVAVYGYEMTGIFAALVLMFYFPCRFNLLAPGLCTFLSLLILGGIHYDAMVSDTAADRMSHTGTLMVMVAKISMFAFHCDDGLKKARGAVLSNHPPIAEQRNKFAIDIREVSLFGFFVYMFEFQGSLVGPLFSYAEYLDFYHNRGDYKNLNKVPFVTPFLKAALRAFCILGLYVYLSKQSWFGADSLLTDWFMAFPFWKRVLLSPFLVAGCRLAYYAVWALSEVSCTLSGLAFVPPSRFTRGRNCNLRMFEMSSNFNSVTNNWNIRISDLWLKQCIYQRVENVPQGISRKGISNFTTKLTSALWHGWYSGYSISFLSLGLCNWSETLLRLKVHPRLPSWLINNPVASVVGWIHTWWSVNLFFAPFLLLRWDKTERYYASIFWCGHLYHLAIILMCSIIPTPREIEKLKSH